MNSPRSSIPILLAALLFSGIAGAQGTLTLDSAEQLARSARDACAANGREIAVAIVDAGGQPLLLSRTPNVGPHNLEAARRKAFTALSTRQSTLALGRQARSHPDTAALQYLPELLLLGGGVPLLRDGAVAGAIGVAGGGGPENDDACARAAASQASPRP